jgi:hypothetical protein
MDQVRFAGSALLPAMLPGREKIRPPQQVQVGLRVIAADLFADFFNPYHRKKVFGLWTLVWEDLCQKPDRKRGLDWLTSPP